MAIIEYGDVSIIHGYSLEIDGDEDFQWGMEEEIENLGLDTTHYQLIVPHSIKGAVDGCVLGYVIQNTYNFEPTELDFDALNLENEEEIEKNLKAILDKLISMLGDDNVEIENEEPKTFIYMHEDDG